MLTKNNINRNQDVLSYLILIVNEKCERISKQTFTHINLPDTFIMNTQNGFPTVIVILKIQLDVLMCDKNRKKEADDDCLLHKNKTDTIRIDRYVPRFYPVYRIVDWIHNTDRHQNKKN